ncbi:hypothetical protein CLV98_103330 [Dyadobacter jejuensis]|uniref:Uncharacterized protein n=1 Tax=Dyadobacter jejuensis TaxID=1082580 RepID=A0A316ANC2_9BACT|nr:hypothetical protein [Dyadobacter jejuensis]PWJ58958.1 hypothetical protein CLV98_103330 [Dyadobacter jejuensis]
MRHIKDIPNNRYKIGLYQWNNKYIIKVESGLYEQTYKIEQYEVSGPEEIETVVDDPFIEAITEKFDSMHHDFQLSLKRNEILF